MTQSPMPDPMSGEDVRRRFVEFFEELGHRLVPSSSLVPHNDPTVLLTTAGMQQMTPYFLGLEQPPAARMVTVQKCFRTVDIEEVGDASHCTFFFMLGNFSVGDYFKRESLAWSWEFLTERLGIPADRLYPTVHPDDAESLAIWRDVIGVPERQLSALDDNWWGPVGPTGPNGPDSEIYFDRGEQYGTDPATAFPGGDSPRFLEVWNNVFMQYLQALDGSRAPLPRQHVDTGMGLERLVMVMQGAESLYDIDLYQTIIQRVATLANVSYGVDAETDRALRIIADHTRGSAFLIADGVLPGNEGRAYVLRRIVRRAVRSGRQLGLERPFLAEVAGVVIQQFADHHPELRDRQRQIERVLTHEEEQFGRTLRAGIGRFESLVADLAGAAAKRGETVAQLLPGDEAFRLHDTFGFPLDLTIELAREHGLEVDRAGFAAALADQRATSRGSAATAFKDLAQGRTELYVAAAGHATNFLGYDDSAAASTVVALIGAEGQVTEADAGQTVEIILDRTPFYGESGGQMGDTGSLRTETGLIDIDDTYKPTPDLIVHRGTVAEGFVRAGEPGRAEIDVERRQAIRRNHTATHLLHRALRLVLGDETHQAGSLVAPERLRFDFTSLDAVTAEQLDSIAEIVNREIVQNRLVETNSSSYQEAVAGGATALFGEKYGDTVRVVTIHGFSRELCGGTHVQFTGEIGPFLILSEGSVAAGVRRIEAVTGTEAVGRMLAQQRTLDVAGRALRVPWSEVPAQIESLHGRIRALEREASRLRGLVAGARIGELLDQAVAVDGTRVLASRVEADSKEGLRQLGDRLRDRLDSGVIMLGTVIDGRPSLLSIVTPDLIARGVRAGDLVREAATVIDGRGGGRPDLAEAGGKDATKLDAALAGVEHIVRRGLGG
ncbi:MAG: alanine--tRNA ligase [Chloroflexota bacterium]|nr:alanine--tRNA ligase [Chloroflexota bacterium]